MRKCFAVFVILFLAVPPALADLEVYLPLDGNLSDASGNGNHGSLVNGTNGTNGFVAAQVGDGLDLGMIDESKAFLEATKTGGDYVAIDYTLPDEGTIALWYQKFPDFPYHFESIWNVARRAPVETGRAVFFARPRRSGTRRAVSNRTERRPVGSTVNSSRRIAR